MAAAAAKPDPTIAAGVAAGVSRYGSPGVPAQGTTYTGSDGNTYDSATGKLVAAGSTTPPDANALKSAAEASVQSSIDAINNTYASLITNENTREANASGKTRAENARGGLMGSDIGDARTSATDAANADQMNKLVSSKQSNVQSVLDKADALAQKQYEDQLSVSQKATSDKIAYYKDQSTQAQTNYLDGFKGGVKLEDMSDQQVQQMLTQTGWTLDQAKNVEVANAPAPTVVHDYVDGSNYYAILRDPATGAITNEKINLGFTVPSGFTMTKGTDGQLIFTPKNGIDPSQPLSSQIHVYTPGAVDTRTTQQKNDESSALNWMRSQPDYQASMEAQFKNDPTIKSRVIQAWKDSTKKATTPAGGVPASPFGPAAPTSMADSTPAMA